MYLLGLLHWQMGSATSGIWENFYKLHGMGLKWSEVKISLLCPTICDPIDYTIHEILQARILEWVAFPFSRASSKLRDWTQVSCIAGRFFISWATRDSCYGLNAMKLRLCHLLNLMLWSSDFVTFLTVLPRPWRLSKGTSEGGVSSLGKGGMMG